ncbi:MAG: flagellar hook-basal body protein [Anaerovoracaceae bacterium]|jgi:flagellar basal-body rod protein FlgG
MIKGFYSGASSLISQQTNMDTIANNVANSSTTSYKPQTVSFSALMYKSIPGGGGPSNFIESGSGTRVIKSGINFKQGELISTGVPTDCAIIGDGFFALESGDGKISYTRDGCFSLSLEGNSTYLVNGEGHYVLDQSGKKVQVDPVTTKKDDKGVSTTSGGFDSSKVGVFQFPNQYGLELTGGNRYLVTEQSGEGEAVKNPKVEQGYLEASGVNVAQEMVKMIEASKSFSFGSRVVQTTDDMEKTINQLR